MPNNSAFKGYRDDQIGVGNEGNSSQVNFPGTYWDPQSNKESEVFHNAAADALVRMGWVMIRDADGNEVEDPRLSRRPEDTEEVLQLRQRLALAEAELKKVNKPKAPAKPKNPSKPKDLTKPKDNK